VSKPLDLLDTPLRATWSLGGADHLPPAQLDRLAGRLAEAGLFFVLLDQLPPVAVLRPLLDRLAGAGIQTSLWLGREDPLPDAGWPLARLLVDAAGRLASEAGRRVLAGDLQRLRERGYAPDLLLVPTRQALPELPELLEFCRDLQVSALKLPNLPVSGRPVSSASAPRPEDLQQLAVHLRQLGLLPLADGLRLEIHDLFLWELLTPRADRSNYSGCQAGNSVAHLDAAGILYPCSSWPEPLGELSEAPLADLWASPRRHAVRDAVDRTPAGCAGCASLAACLGGCRGLARVWNADGGDRDLMCEGPR